MAFYFVSSFAIAQTPTKQPALRLSRTKNLHFAKATFPGFSAIGKIIAQELSIPIDNTCCLHVKNTPHQISLSGKQRHKNIKNAFQLRTIPKAHHIAILDDVLTTGATANELASGISRVDVWVCARA
jgi:predicted amidophosphoribosyltransferase